MVGQKTENTVEKIKCIMCHSNWKENTGNEQMVPLTKSIMGPLI